MTIERSNLSDLTPLSSLRSVSGALTIRENAALRSLDGLERLERARSLRLADNGLYGTRGIEGLRQVDTLVISNNRFLISLRGFRGLTRVGTLVLDGNPRVCALFGLFSGLTRVDRVAVSSNLGLSREDVTGLLARIRRGAP